MSVLAGKYTLGAQIHDGRTALVYRARRNADGAPVIIKLLERAEASPDVQRRLHFEFEIASSLPEEVACTPTEFLELDDSLAMITEDRGYVSLSLWLAQRTPTLLESLRIASEVAGCLARIHSRDILHRDLSPSNIVIHPMTLETRVIDFALSSVIPRNVAGLTATNRLEGTLAYISPEQTGRINRLIDARSDLYSLGAIFYELFTGAPPFMAADPLELVHAHIAREPPLAERVFLRSGTAVPPQLSRVLDLLLRKTPEERYQSAAGLQLDLDRCIRSLEQTGQLEEFPLRSRDVSDRFRIPQTLYGRVSDLQRMAEAFARTGDATQLVIVSGAPGIGKTAFVHEVHRAVSTVRGRFISANFDQLRRRVPRASLLNGLREIAREIAGGSAQSVERFAPRLREALHPNGRLIADLIPEFAPLLGETAPIPELEPIEARRRFDFVMQRLIEVLATEEHPLVVFLDDLQWADNASLNLLMLMSTNLAIKHLLIIVAYRQGSGHKEDGVGESRTAHIQRTVAAIAAAGTNITFTDLGPLEHRHVVELLQESLAHPSEELDTFASLILEKTAGVPFFIEQFLHALYEERLLNFDPESLRWRWELGSIRARHITDNVVELMVQKIHKLQPAAQRYITLAACIGEEFDLQTTANAAGSSPIETGMGLWDGVTAGLLIPIGGGHGFSTIPGRSSQSILDPKARYRFLHDRVREAAYSMLSGSDQVHTHRKVGRFLLERARRKQTLEENVFHIVDQLNRSTEGLPIGGPEAVELADLNVMAAARAEMASAPGPALRYLKLAASFLPEGALRTGDERAFAIAMRTMHMEHLNGEHESAVARSATLLAVAKRDLDKVKIHELRLTLSVGRHDFPSAFAEGFAALGYLGVELPRAVTPEVRAQCFADVAQLLSELRSEDILALPVMTDARVLSAQLILSSLVTLAYRTQPEFAMLFVREMFRLCTAHGNSTYSAFIFDSLAFGCSVFGDLARAKETTELAAQLELRYPNPRLFPRSLIGRSIAVSPWLSPLRECIDGMLRGGKLALEVGDVEMACLGPTVAARHMIAAGYTLDEIAREAGLALETAEKYRLKAPLAPLRGILHFVDCLQTPCDSPGRRVGAAFDEAVDFAAMLLSPSAVVTRLQTKLYGAVLAYILGDYAVACEAAEAAMPFLAGAPAQQITAEHAFVRSLARLARERTATVPTPSLLEDVKAEIERMDSWAVNAPATYKHKSALLRAERSSLLGEHLAAMAAYDEAIDEALRNGFVQYEAIASERCAEFYLGLGRTSVASVYFRKARNAYQRWGAPVKVTELDKHVVRDRKSSRRGSSTGSLLGSEDALDAATIVKATRAISGELDLERLVVRLLEILLENAGADRGFVILTRNGTTTIEAQLDLRAASGPQSESVPFSTEQSLSVAVVDYVQRTQETVVLDNPAQGDKFTECTHIQKMRPKGILCTPLLNQQELVGIFYLENTLASGTFSQDRLDIVKLIAGHAALSVHNAVLYATLEERVEARTLELQDQNKKLATTLKELRQTQGRLLESERLAALGRIVAGVSHELGTPLGNALIASSTLEDNVNQLAKSHATEGIRRSQLEEFLDVSKSSSQLVRSNLGKVAKLLDTFKTVAVDRTSDRRRRFDLKTAVEDAVWTIQPEITQRRHTISVECEAHLQLDSYPGPLRQVLTNLVMNSLVHGFPPGRIGHVDIRVKDHGDTVRIVVSDNGVGVPESARARVFEPFYTTKLGQGGSGLGLHICTSIASGILGGSLELLAPETGAAFALEIPRIAPDAG